MSKPTSISVFAFAFGWLAMPFAHGQTYTWTGNGSGNGWGSSGNFQEGDPPFNADTNITFYSNPARLLNALGSDRTIGSLTFNDTADNAVGIRLSNDANGVALNLTMGNATVAPTINVDAGSTGNHIIGTGGETGTFGSVILGGNLTVTHNGTGTLTIDRPVTGTGFGVTKAGSGTLILSGANTYTGGTTLNGGTVIISNATSFGTGNVSITGASQINATAGLTYANAIDVGDTLTLKQGTFTTNNSNPGGSAEFTGILSGSSTLNIANSFSGNSQANLDFTNTGNTFTGSVIGAAGNSNGADYFRFASIGDGGTFTFNKSGNRGGVTYLGSVDIEFSSRQIALGTSFGNIINGNNVPINAFQNNGTGTVTFNTDLSVGNIGSNGTFFFDGSNTGNNTFAGIIPNSSTNVLGIGKNGTGKWILTGANGFDGEVVIRQGTLSVSTIAASSATNQPLGNNPVIQLGDRNTSGILEFTGATSITDKQVRVGLNSNHAGTGSILNNGTGSLAFTNATFNPVATSTVNRTLTLGGTYDGSGGANDIQGVVQNNSTGLVALSVSGSEWALSGDNTYTGATTVSGGTLRVNGNSTLATGLVTVASGATLGGNGTVGGATTVSGFLAPGNSPGVLGFSSSLTLNGTAETVMEIDGTVRDTSYDGVDVGTTLTYGGNLTLDFGTTFGSDQTFNLFDFAGESGSFSNVALTGSYVASLVNDGFGVWTGTTNSGDESWTFTQSTGDLSVVVVPEPTTLTLLGASAALFGLRFTRRRA